MGGGVVEAMPQLFVDAVKDSVNSYTMPSLIDDVKVVPAKLGDDAVALGAAGWVNTI